MRIDSQRKGHHRSRVTALVLAAGLSCACVPGLSWAGGSANEGLPGDWLSRYSTPRAIGLGGASVAVGQEPQSALWNPAGLSWLRTNVVQVTGLSLFDGTSVAGFGFVVPASKLPSFGVNFLALKSGNFERTNDLNEVLGTFSEGDIVMALTVAQELAPGWSVGTNVKLVRQTFEDFSGGGVGLDLGVLGEVLPGVKLGASALNLGGPTITLRAKAESYAKEYRAGVSVALWRGRGLVTAETVHRNGPGNQLRLGGQYGLNALSLRLGYAIDHFAAGFGYTFENGLSFDYGVNDHPLGLVHRVGLSYAFGGFYATSQAQPEVFSPMGYNPVTKFLLTAHTKDGVREWQLEIKDRSGEVVRSYAGHGQPPAQVIWDGKGAVGLPLPDGFYTYALTVVESDGRKTMARSRTVEINTGGPRGSMGVE